jgi:hypothetical protein
VGILPLFLVFIRIEGHALFRSRVFFLVTAGISLFLALGKYNPIYPAIYHLPGFDHFRIPAQILFIYVFSVATLSGLGIDRIQRSGWRFSKAFVPLFVFLGGVLSLFKIGILVFPFRFLFHLFLNFAERPVGHANLTALYQRIDLSVNKAILLFFISLALVLACRYRKLSTGLFSFLTSGIVFLDLFLFGSQFLQNYDFNTPTEKERLIGQLPRDPSKGRVIAEAEAFRANEGMRYKFPSIFGYDPLILRRYLHFFLSSQDWEPDDQVVNVEHVSKPDAKLLKLLNTKWQIVDGKVKQIDNDLPYVMVVADAVTRPPEETLPFMKSDAFDPKHTVVLETTHAERLVSGHHEDPLDANCAVTHYSSERINMRVSTNRPAYLVLSEIYYPGWVATVDGKRTDLLRGNYLFRVIALEKGDHEIQLSFISWPFRIGAFISLMTLVGSLWLLLRVDRSSSEKKNGKLGSTAKGCGRTSCDERKPRHRGEGRG